MQFRSYQIVLLLVGLIVPVIFIACTDLALNPWGGQVSMISKYTSAVPASAHLLNVIQVDVDSIKITRARFVFERIQFTGTGDSSEFKTRPFIYEPSLTGSYQQILVAGLKYGTYNRVKFKVHKVQVSDLDSLSTAEQSMFADFLAGDNYSVIIEGVYYPAGQGPQLFTYRSKIDAEQQFGLSIPITLSESFPNGNVTMTLSSYYWFMDLDGSLLDPTNPDNANEIDNSLRRSIKVYKDDNKDGIID
jgi:hypothetical protein